MKIERLILVFKKNGDSLVKEINVDDLKISTIKKIFKPKQDDPNFYKPYQIKKIQYDKLISYKAQLKSYSYSKFDLRSEERRVGKECRL